ncbi:MAG: ABC transporter substrate-binding protein [Fluviicola sp.]|nr:ABC transporter substrate-binding protein [Fluviicola sp.]MBP6272402.1 ABC transporter substrate-binding protein [Fluviicola sp.]
MKTIIAFSALLLLFGCTPNQEELSAKKAIGGATYGGEFRFMSPEKVGSLIPIQAVDIYTQRITSQIFEQLVALDPTGQKIEPCLSTAHTVSNDGLVYTFQIRKGVFFHPDECFQYETRELDANDIKFTLDLACSGLAINEVSWLLIDRIKGAKTFFTQSKKSLPKKGVSGIKVINKNTLEITLNEPLASFEKILSYSGFGVFPKEAYDYYGKDLGKHPVGTGPFILDKQTDQAIRLTRNNNYWKKDQFGNELPFLGSVLMTYAANKRSELIAFRSGKIDLVLEIPADEVKNVLGSLSEAQAGKNIKHKVDAQASYSLAFLGFQHKHPILKDKRVRKAINLAIDRGSIVNNELQGDGYPIENGIIPSALQPAAYKVKGYKTAVPLAQQLLKEAGYENGENFPVLTIFVNDKKDSDKHKLVAAIVKQLKRNLNIQLKIKLVDLATRNQLVENGTAAIWLSGWVADYPDGENFMGLFVGNTHQQKSKFVNPFNYYNPDFNNYFVQANGEKTNNKHAYYLQKCDQLLIDDAVIVPLISDDFITLTNLRVRKFITSPLEVIQLKTVYIKEPKMKHK